eukprot:TRINITY_DN24539_c0_g1_i1.p1 TRINITY_DN24539_c0_g1~~TRINITY_DN24539_c0_g1_i1.p1  ORF type:complete len:489 (+),score=162.84 TRINITY_DN24539_c0_g1_i1:106-1467(+)
MAARPKPRVPKVFAAPVSEASPQPADVQQGILSKVWARSTDLCVSHGKGVYVYDMHGQEYMDLAAGIAVTNTGHAHPKVVAAIQQQAERMLHSQINNYHNAPLYELTKRLGAVLPEGVNHVYYDNTGTAAIEAAVKMVRQATKRPHIVTLFGGMHGRSGMCSAMTSNHSIRNPVYYPLPSGVYTAPFPYAFRMGVSEEEAAERALSGLKDLVKAQVRPDQVAAVVFEPILGEGGFVPASTAYYTGVRELCNEHGWLLVMDEIQSGYGRSGTMWAHQHFDAAGPPDILVSSKGIASGMPLSMVAATQGVMDTFTPGTHGGTFNGNPVALAAAIATLDVFEEEDLLENATRQGAMLKSLLKSICEVHSPRSDVRGRGLMIGLECMDADGAPSKEQAQFVKQHCQRHHNVLLLTPTGFDGNILRIMPALVIREEEVVRAAQAVEHALLDWNKVSLA